MFYYKALTTITLASGVIALDAAQAAKRRLNLHRIGDDLFKILAPIELKRGEAFGYDSPLKGPDVETVEAPQLKGARRYPPGGARLPKSNGIEGANDRT